MILKLWVAFALMMTAAQCHSVDTYVKEKLDILFERLTIVEDIVENMTADVLKLRNMEEKCCAVDDDHGNKDIKHRLIDVEGKLDKSTPQVDYLGDQVKKLWVEVREIRSKGAVPKANPTLHHEVPSTTNSKKEEKKEGTDSRVIITEEKEEGTDSRVIITEEKKEGTDSRVIITDAIINSTHAFYDMLSNLKTAARDTLDNSLYEMNSYNELGGNYLSYLAHTVEDAVSNYTTCFRRLIRGSNRYSYKVLRQEESKLKSILSQAFSRVSKAIQVNFKNLKQMIKSKLSNFSDEINNSRDASRKAFSNLRECHCKRVE